jgi:hypothetical protein
VVAPLLATPARAAEGPAAPPESTPRELGVAVGGGTDVPASGESMSGSAAGVKFGVGSTTSGCGAGAAGGPGVNGAHGSSHELSAPDTRPCPAPNSSGLAQPCTSATFLFGRGAQPGRVRLGSRTGSGSVVSQPGAATGLAYPSGARQVLLDRRRLGLAPLLVLVLPELLAGLAEEFARHLHTRAARRV